MDIREKLIELLHVSVCDYDCDKCKYSISDEVCIRHLEEMAADHLIANGVTIQEWIPVSKPPKEEGEYWVAHKLVDEYFYNTAIYDGVCFRFKLAGSVIPNITHWSYLSPPSKGEQVDG